MSALAELPNGWVRTTLSTACDVVMGQSPPGETLNGAGDGVPFFQGKAEFGKSTATVRKWTSDPKRHARAGSILLSVRAPVGAINYAPVDCAIGRGLAAIDAGRASDQKFIFWYLNFAQPVLEEQGTGTTFSAVNGPTVRNFRLPLPPLAEQHRIVQALEEQLSRLDAAASYTAHAQTSFKALEKSLLHETWKRAEGYGGLTPIGEVAETTLGKMLDARKNSGVPTPYLANINVRWGSFRMDSLRSVPLESREVDKFSIKAGDVLICEGGEPGRCAVWNSEDRTIAFQKALHRARCRVSIRPHWLALCLKAAVVSGKTDRLLTGTTIKHLPQEKLRALKIPVPSLETQDELLLGFQEVMESLLRQGEAIEIHTRRSKHLREMVLASAFAGTLVDQDPADEPASVLLERIAAERANAKPTVRRRASVKAKV